MSKPISVGDLVQVVRICCKREWLNHVFQVTDIIPNLCAACITCGKPAPERFLALGLSIYAIPLSWLKRIPPLEELEGEKQKEDLREPA